MIVDWLNANEKNENINHKLIKQNFLENYKINTVRRILNGHRDILNKKKVWGLGCGDWRFG